MTIPQSGYLLVWSNRMGIIIPFIVRADANGQKVTKAEASMLLTKFEHGELVEMGFIDGLGRKEPDASEPDHPLTWACCHEPPSGWQMTWIEQLTMDLGIPFAVMHKGTLGITRGQASELIKLLRAAKDESPRKQRDAKWLDRAVTTAIEEVPLPDEGEGVDADYDPDTDGIGKEMDEDEEDEEEEMEYREARLDARELRALLVDAEPDLMSTSSHWCTCPVYRCSHIVGHSVLYPVINHRRSCCNRMRWRIVFQLL